MKESGKIFSCGGGVVIKVSKIFLSKNILMSLTQVCSDNKLIVKLATASSAKVGQNRNSCFLQSQENLSAVADCSSLRQSYLVRLLLYPCVATFSNSITVAIL